MTPPPPPLTTPRLSRFELMMWLFSMRLKYAEVDDSIAMPDLPQFITRLPRIALKLAPLAACPQIDMPKSCDVVLSHRQIFSVTWLSLPSCILIASRTVL